MTPPQPPSKVAIEINCAIEGDLLELFLVFSVDEEKTIPAGGLGWSDANHRADSATSSVSAVTTLTDLQVLKEAFAGHTDLLFGAITGRAIYEGTLDLAAGQALLDG